MECDPVDRCECALYERTTAWVVYWCENQQVTRSDDRVQPGRPCAAAPGPGTPVARMSEDRWRQRARVLREAAVILEEESTDRDWGVDLPALTDAAVYCRYFADKIGGLEHVVNQEARADFIRRVRARQRDLDQEAGGEG